MHNALFIDSSTLHLSPTDPLKAAARQLCSRCQRQRSFLCQDCVVPLTKDVPQVKLPVKVDVAQHGETNARGTGVHAAILAPDDVRLFRHSSGTSHHRKSRSEDLELPDYDIDNTVVLFPESKETEVVGRCQKFSRIVVLDGSWPKARSMLQHPKLRNMRRVQLPQHLRTTFWRRGEGTFRGAVEEGVCTIEAIYWLCRTLAAESNYDDLLWYYMHIRSIVKAHGTARTRTLLDAMDEEKHCNNCSPRYAYAVKSAGCT